MKNKLTKAQIRGIRRSERLRKFLEELQTNIYIKCGISNSKTISIDLNEITKELDSTPTYIERAFEKLEKLNILRIKNKKVIRIDKGEYQTFYTIDIIPLLD